MSEIARRERSKRQHWAAPGSSHDRLVRGAMIVLPTAIGILTAFLVMAPMFSGGDVSFVLDKNKVEVAKERLKIQEARYRGADSKGQPFELTAGSAVQRTSAEPVVQMNELAAAIRLPDGPAQLTAERGRYDMDKEAVAVDGPIRFQTADGYRVETRDAVVDLKTRKLNSTGAVDGTSRLGTFSGDRLRGDLEARTLTLSGNARLRILPNAANRR